MKEKEVPMKPMTRREVFKRSGRLLLGAAACSFAQGLACGCSNREVDPEAVSRLMRTARTVNIGNIRLTVVYDNIPYDDKLRTDWGFSCLVEGLDKTILFDAGRYDDIFMSNLSNLRIDPRQIDDLFLSHDHPDHIGGTLKLLEANPEIDVFLVRSFPSGFKKVVRASGATISDVDQPQHVTSNCLSTGEMKSVVENEHSLVILTEEGSIIITGCAHPGVVDIVERAKTLFNRDVLLLAGGFHLSMDSAEGIREKALRLKALGVRCVAPSHCSGKEAMAIFAEVYGRRFIKSGVGRTISSSDFSFS
jgi:7,8-dihydropterin-6-yl-methyl-4-(beta-D-ribofuranosyl)aminobenzene 5'-phosphate synthase